jgi:hypothetical protein
MLRVRFTIWPIRFQLTLFLVDQPGFASGAKIESAVLLPSGRDAQDSASSFRGGYTGSL